MMSIEQQIRAAAVAEGLDPELALAVARRESGLDPEARGAAGEVGLFQLMPATAAELGVNPHNLADNIRGGVRYLREQFDRFGDWAAALAAYNAGPGNVSRGTIPSSTQQYVTDIFSLWSAPEPPAIAEVATSPVIESPVYEQPGGDYLLPALGLSVAALFFIFS